MRSQANFLTSGETYEFDLPDVLDAQPELSGVVALDGGARQITYRPFARAQDPKSNRGLKQVFATRQSGHTVTVYKTLESPLQLVAYWSLPEGFLATFMNDDTECGADLDAGIRTVISNLAVRITKFGLPRVQLGAPLTAGDLRDPFEREYVGYLPREGSDGWPVVKLRQDPPWTNPGSAAYERAGAHVASETNALDVTVEAIGPRARATELRQQAKQIASSFVPAR